VAGCIALPSALGGWLVTSDPLQPAGAIVVFGGGLPFRAMEAARIYHQGLAPTVWLTQGAPREDDLELARLGVNRTSEYVYSEEVLRRLGVPSAAIHILPQPVLNTAEEVRCIAQAAATGHLHVLILVTSKYHTRRVKILWRALTPEKIQAIVRYDSDPFDSRSWWRRTGDAMAVSREVFGIANAWMGFPIKSESW
jgi:uncharacterized SAM-binding protein YcdF (DUF218 family)